MADFEEMHRAYYNAMKPLLDNDFLRLDISPSDELGLPSPEVFLDHSKWIYVFIKKAQENLTTI